MEHHNSITGTNQQKIGIQKQQMANTVQNEETSAFDDNAYAISLQSAEHNRISQDELDEMLAFEMQLKYQEKERRIQQQIDEEVQRRLEMNEKYINDHSYQASSFEAQQVPEVHPVPQNVQRKPSNPPSNPQANEQKVKYNEITIEEIIFKFDS